ncbi:MAG: formylglycine-generating enzyme family protein [Magnetococcales bacterium]|nr:formylglycine-generating enzyme family protein [Magnetococcales bacterium]
MFCAAGLLVLLCLSWPGAATAFPIKEWDKLDVGESRSLSTEVAQPGKPWQEPLSGMHLVWVPGGCFRMGSAPNAEGRDADEEPLHTVCLSGFWLGEREVTQQQWQRVLQNNPSQLHHEVIGQPDEGFPVENISRLDIESLLTKLNGRHRGQVVFDLPSEAQWEYACRSGGEKTTFAGYAQVDQLGWYRSNSSGTSQTTGSRRANRLGLFDMSGNLWEWVRDTYDKEAYRRHGNNDPVYTGDAPFAVIRGGGWQDEVGALRCANRGFERLTNKRADLGVRLLATVDVKAKDAQKAKEGRSKMPF